MLENSCILIVFFFYIRLGRTNYWLCVLFPLWLCGVALYNLDHSLNMIILFYLNNTLIFVVITDNSDNTLTTLWSLLLSPCSVEVANPMSATPPKLQTNHCHKIIIIDKSWLNTCPLPNNCCQIIILETNFFFMVKMKVLSPWIEKGNHKSIFG